MSNLRTRAEHERLGGAPWCDFDSEYRFHAHKIPQVPPKETRMETPTVDETEQGVDAPVPERPESPKSLALAVVAANAVHAAWESGYLAGFNAGKLAGLDTAMEIINKPTGQISTMKFSRENPPF